MVKNIFVIILPILGIQFQICDGSILSKTAPRGTNCVEFRTLLEKSFVEAASLFFADNPNPNRPQFTPSMVKPLEAQNLYKEYYGEGASPHAFKRVIVDILQADPGCEDIERDKVILRSEIYKYAKEQNFGIARKKFGLLLYRDMSDFGDVNWIDYRCILSKDVDLAEGIIASEISRLRRGIGDWTFGKFFALGVGTTLAFAIDDTGSMSEEIEAARRRSHLLIDERAGSVDQPTNFVLVPFNDPKVGPVTSTGDPNRLKEAFRSVYAHGGGDLPELSMKGISLALDKVLAGSTIYVITDAEARDAELQDQIIATANRKMVKLVFLLTNKMSTWLCAGFSSTRRLTACRDPSLKLGFELYQHLANSTGGEVLVVRRKDIFKSTGLLDVALQHGIVNLERRTITNGDSGFELFVDSGLRELYVEATGACDTVKLRSNGAQIQFERSIKVAELFIGSINVTKYGKYRLNVKTTGICRVKVTGKSTKSFVQSLAKEIGNVTTTQCLKVIHHQPVSTEKVVVLVDMYGLNTDDVVRTVSFVDVKTGESVYSFRVPDGKKRHFRVKLESFADRKLLAYVSGIDAGGFQFRRLAQQSIQFVNVEIDCSALDKLVLRPGSPAQVAITIRNVGKEAVYYTVNAVDGEKFITSVSQSRILVTAGGDAKFFLRLRTPRDAKPGSVSKVTVTVKDQNGVLVYKECLLAVSAKQAPAMESFKITSNINTRFAETIVQSKFVNDGWVSKESVFSIVIPPNAFITDFTMTVDGDTFSGEIKQLGEAKTFYEIGKREGLSFGHLSSQDEGSKIFQTSLNLRGDEDVVFQIKYQQPLVRSVGRYHHEINVQPGQAVKSFDIEINIWESLPLSDLKVLNFRTEQSSLSKGIHLKGTKISESGNSAKITFSPTMEQQTLLSPNGLNGKFAIQYDLVRPGDKISEMVAFDQNFLHFFVSKYEPMNKRVVFLLDNSGSMFGRKLMHMKNGMNKILDELNSEDSFAILMFNSKVQSWDPHPGEDSRSIMVKATAANIAAAKRFLNSVTAQAGTDLLKGLEAAINVIDGYVEDEDINSHFSTDYVFVLTDGGRSQQEEIGTDTVISTITSFNSNKFGIHITGYGAMANSKVLSSIAHKNQGTFIQIHEDIDANVQINNFFKTIAYPVLREVQIRYPSGRLIPTTALNFQQYQKGTEIVVAGEFADTPICVIKTDATGEDDEVDVTFSAKTDGEDVYLEESLFPTCDENEDELQDLIERQENYLKLVETLKELENETDPTKLDELKEKVTNISRGNSFVVNDYTALVVSKPGNLKEVDDTIASEIEEETQRLQEASTTPVPTTIPITTRSVPEGSVVTPAFGRIPFSTIIPFTASRPSLLFFGDPHFVIDIEEQITLCFNWEGQDGQTISLLHDQEKGITVNGKLVTSKAPGKSVRSSRTYVNKIGINIHELNMTIVITSKEAVFRTAEGVRKSLVFGKYGTTRYKGVVLKVNPVTKFRSTLFVHIKRKVVFRVISRINSKSKFVRDHLDFAVLRGDGLTENAVGVLGQFSRFKTKAKVPASIDFRSDGKTAVLWYRHNPIEVSYHTLRDYNLDRDVECWYMADKGQLWENDGEKFVVKGILDPPEMQKIDHR